MLRLATGNMYHWVTHIGKNYVGGRCPHGCIYCYMEAMKKRYPLLEKIYSGELYLIEKELTENLGKGKTIFNQNCGELYADAVPSEWIEKVNIYNCKYPDNVYLNQSKNPKRFQEFITVFPPKVILGTTIETNREMPGISNAPSVNERARAMTSLSGFKKMINIEPIMDFDLEPFVKMIFSAEPTFVSVGADSKEKYHKPLDEPSYEKVQQLIKELKRFTEVKVKSNLRLLAPKGSISSGLPA